MANDLDIKQPNLVQLQSEKNFFQLYAEQVVRNNIIGQLLKFAKGDWSVGRDSTPIEIGTKLAASMDSFQIGWIKWGGNKVQDELMGQSIPPKRATLGDLDESEWELNADGSPRDPWQFTNRLVLKLPGEHYHPDDAFTFYTSSQGGIRTCGELAAAYGNRLALDDTCNPIVELGVDSYMHPNKSFGRIKIPKFTIVAWEDKALFTEIVPEPEPSKAAKAKRR